MSDHIEESLRGAAETGRASSQLRSRLERQMHLRRMRARAISGTGIAALAILAITAIPRSSSANELYGEVSKAFRNGKGFRITMYKHYEGDPERVSMVQLVHPDGVTSTFFKDSVMEFSMREDDGGAVLFFPHLKLAQRPEKSDVSWREMAPRKDEDLLAYVQRRLVADSMPEESKAGLKPDRAVATKLDGRAVIRLDFEDNFHEHTHLKFELYADQATKEPVLLKMEMRRQTPRFVRKLNARYTFESVNDVESVLRGFPTRDVPIIDREATLEKTKGMADISPLFGGVRRAFRGPHGALVLVTREPAFSGRAPVSIGGADWIPCITAPFEIGDSKNPDFYWSTFTLLEDREQDWNKLPFPVESKAGAWPDDAGGLVAGRSLAKEFTEVAFARALRWKDLKEYERAIKVLEEASKEKLLLVPGVTVAVREALSGIREEMQR